MNKTTRKIVYAALAAAIIFTVTRLVVIPIGATGGYVNFGDIAIYLCAYLLGGPVSAAAAAVGSALSDLTTPWAIYAPATFVIKGLMGLLVGAMLKKHRSFWMFALASALGGAVMLVGYGLYDTVLVGFPGALANAWFNLFQWGGSVIISWAIYPVAQRISKLGHFDELL